MKFVRTTLAVTAAAAVALGGAANAYAAPQAPAKAKRPAASVKALSLGTNDWLVGLKGGDINPKLVYPTAGSTYTITGQVAGISNGGTGSYTLEFNTAPAGGDITCSATATGGGQVNGGRITWQMTGAGETTVDYTINCKYVRDHSGAVDETLTLRAMGHAAVDANTRGDSAETWYTIGGTLPTPTPTATPTTTAKPTPAPTPTPKKPSKKLPNTGF